MSRVLDKGVRRRALLGVFLLVSGAAPAVAETAVSSPARPLKIIATTSILADFVRNIGGADVSVTSLVPPDGDAHIYEPKPGDVKAIAAADLLVENGLGLESWLDRLIAAAGYSHPVTIATSLITPLHMTEKGRDIVDPHAWQDVGNARRYVVAITQALISIDPTHRAAYQRRAENYDDALIRLNRHVQTTLEAIPTEKRRVITTHDAFQYYGKAYRVSFIAPEGISTEEGEPSAADLARIETAIRSHHTRALFLENMTDSRLIKQIARDTGAIVGPELFSDALSFSDKPAATYIGMMTYNTDMLAKGMQQN